ncbi:hypothetical protein BDA99DRAFT_559423 [Phascolomyces articulosus]|uniref:DNA repair protein SWI5 homolog n=1 Tax=Phascolomyces articulosus TaxID=60185 RepID=A0AAD5K0W9_9FUNG|nr:hypothetical protein BDA99DRAFT_559423 [Phascolomyces articulosus]
MSSTMKMNKKRVEDLRIEYETLCNELQMDEKDASRLLQRRIQLLHEYNDLKDTAIRMIGVYAHQTGKTLQEVYSQFNVDPTVDQ